tara:strand:+ start:613 stop:882 length:270 start_codon:yes stop_codon:yes gene_type:complete
VNPSLKQIDDKIEELEAILPKLEKASEERHVSSDTGWWITMAGNPGGTALAVTAGNQAHEVDQLISQVERRLVLLRATRIDRQSQVASS